MKELELLEKVKDKLELVEIQAFHRRIISLHSNFIYWTNRQSHEKASERQEAVNEFKRCEQLLAKVVADLKKKERHIC